MLWKALVLTGGVAHPSPRRMLKSFRNAMRKEIFIFLTSSAFGFVLKLVAGIATAGFGILGIGAKTRDDAGRLTSEGKVALIGILISAIIGGASGVYDFVSGQRAAEVERQKSQRLMLSVQRGIYPLRGITGDLVIGFRQDFLGLADYKTTLRKALPAHGCTETPEYYCEDDNDSGTVWAIPERSPLFPRRNSAVRRVLDQLGVSVSLVSAHEGSARKPY